MNKRKRTLLSSLLLALIMTLGLSFQSLAARIAFTDLTADVGDEISVNMRITGSGDETIVSSDIMLSYDSSVLEFVSGTGATGGAGSIRVVGTAEDQNSRELLFTLKFRTLRAGESKITVSTQEVYDKDSQLVSIDREGSSAITINGLATDSADASLSALQISPGTLVPEFSPEVTSYTVTVGGDVEKVVVNAPAKDGAASVSVSGGEGLQLGENQIICTVTAQNGAQKTYTVTVNKVEGQVSDGTGAAEGVTLRAPAYSVTVLVPEEGMEVPAGLEARQVSIDNQEVQGWVAAGDTSAHCIFYAVNENGETGFYRYDIAEKTLQRYYGAGSTVTNEEYARVAQEYNSLLKDYNMRFWFILGLIALSVVLLIVIIVLLASRRKNDDFFEQRMDRRGASQERKERRPEVRRETRRESREERYLRDMEEEEAFREEDDLEEPGRSMDETQIFRTPISGGDQEPGMNGETVAFQPIRRERRSGQAADGPEEEFAETKTASRVPAEDENDDDDFESIDLGL